VREPPGSPRSTPLENTAAADLDLSDDALREIEEAQIEAEGHRYGEANERTVDR